MKRISAAVLAVLTALCLVSCAQQAQTAESFAMDTVVTQTVYADDDSAIVSDNEIIARLENEMSATIADSDVSRMNAGGSVEVSAETAEVLSACLKQRATRAARFPRRSAG